MDNSPARANRDAGINGEFGKELPELDFPVEPSFISHPPTLDPQVMLNRIAETMPWRSSRPGERERRLAEKIDIQFSL